MKKNNIIMKCCVCQRVKTDRGWDYQFIALDDSDVFSHGYCPVCYKKAIQDLESEALINAIQLTR